MLGRTRRTVGLLLAQILVQGVALGGIASTAHAGGPPWGYTPDRVLFTWTGRVDREVVLSLRGPALREGGIDGWLPSRARVLSPLPRANGLVLVRIDDGRGYVDVIEQPSAWNGYTALIRILDPRGGADGYRLTVYWDRDARGVGRRAPVWDPRWDPRWDDRWDDRWDPRWEDRRGRDPRGARDDDRYGRNDSRNIPRTAPREEDRRGYDPRRDPRRDPGFVWGREGAERRGPPQLRVPDQPPDSSDGRTDNR